MKITQTHLDFWESHQPRPSWAAKIKRPKIYPGTAVDMIDSCINIQAGRRPTHGEVHLSNLISLIRCRVGIGDTRALVTYLYYLANNEDPMHKRRAATARKWANKIRFGKQVPRAVKAAVAA